MRWDDIGTTTGPTRIGGVVIPEGSQLQIPIAEPVDMETCPACEIARNLYGPMDEIELFTLHLERHLVPTVRHVPPRKDRPRG